MIPHILIIAPPLALMVMLHCLPDSGKAGEGVDWARVFHTIGLDWAHTCVYLLFVGLFVCIVLHLWNGVHMGLHAHACLCVCEKECVCEREGEREQQCIHVCACETYMLHGICMQQLIVYAKLNNCIKFDLFSSPRYHQ